MVKPKGCIILLAGRGSTSESMRAYYKDIFPEITILGIDLHHIDPTFPYSEWYPAPNGPNDQAASVEGLKATVKEIQNKLLGVQIKYELKSTEIALAGFSAGAVVALAVGMVHPLAAVISHAGAILEPDKIPEAQYTTPFLLIHNLNDQVFKWWERYIPTKKALKKKKYNAHFIENTEDFHFAHSMKHEDIGLVKIFLTPIFGIK